jgi:hypothetical protein
MLAAPFLGSQTKHSNMTAQKLALDLQFGRGRLSTQAASIIIIILRYTRFDFRTDGCAFLTWSRRGFNLLN